MLNKIIDLIESETELTSELIVKITELVKQYDHTVKISKFDQQVHIIDHDGYEVAGVYQGFTRVCMDS